MKQVFSNSQCCHVWASQSQDTGRNSQNNIYFKGTEIFSYGSHYLMAKIWPDNGNCVLINEHSYSPSTAKHLSHVYSAVSHMKSYCVSNPSDPHQSIKDMGDELIEFLFSVFAQNKPHPDLNNYFEKYNQLCRSFGKGKDQLEIPKDLRELLEEHIQFRKSRNIDADKKRENKLEQIRIKQAEYLQIDLIRWLDGETIFKCLNAIEPKQIRVRGDIVETTGGAEVPLSHALRLLDAVKSGKVKRGAKIGHFEFESLEQGIVTIGCHTVNLEHAKAVLEAVKGE